MIPLTWKFNSKQLLSKTLNSRMNIIETRAVLNIVKTDGKWAPEGKREGLFFTINFNFNQLCIKKLNSRTNTKKVSSARGDPWV